MRTKGKEYDVGVVALLINSVIFFDAFNGWNILLTYFEFVSLGAFGVTLATILLARNTISGYLAMALGFGNIIMFIIAIT